VSTVGTAILKKFLKKFRVLAGVRAVLPIDPDFAVVHLAVLLDGENHRFGGVVVLDRGDSEPLLAHCPVGGVSSAPVRSIGRLVVCFNAVEFVRHAGINHFHFLKRGSHRVPVHNHLPRQERTHP